MTDELAWKWALDCYLHYDPPHHCWEGPSRNRGVPLTEDECWRCRVKRATWEQWVAVREPARTEP